MLSLNVAAYKHKQVVAAVEMKKQNVVTRLLIDR